MKRPVKRTAPLLLAVSLSMLLLLSFLGIAYAQVKNTPPSLASAALEKTTLYRGLQTLRGNVSATDKETAPARLVVTARIDFADFQTLTARLVFNPALRLFQLFLPLPDAVGAGAATVTFTVTDAEGATNSTRRGITVLDQKPVLEKRDEARRAISAADAVLEAWGSLGVTMTSARQLLADAEKALSSGELALRSLEDVDGAVRHYEDTVAKAGLAIERGRLNVGTFTAARDAAEAARAVLERARALVSTWKALGADVKAAEDQLGQAERSFEEGQRALKVEGSPGAAAAFTRAKALAEFAIKAAEDAAKIFDARQKAGQRFLDVRQQLAAARLEADTTAAFTATLKAAGVDVTRAETLLKWVDDALKKLENELKVETAPAVADSLKFVSQRVGEARREASAAAEAFAQQMITRAKALLSSVKGGFLAPDASFAEGMLESAEAAFAKKDYALAIARVQGAAAEFGRLQAAQAIASNFTIGPILVIVVAIILAALFLRRRRAAAPV